MKTLNPDSLELASGDEMLDRQRRTGEVGDGKIVYCSPNLEDPYVVQQVSRAVCLKTPYQACFYCPHHRFEYIFALPTPDWVQCPRWGKEAGTREPDFYAPVSLSECRAKPHPFCPQCPSQEELVQLSIDKKKDGWLGKYRRLTKED